MFGHQDDQQYQQADNQAMDQNVNAIVNNDVTPPQAGQTFTPPEPVSPTLPYTPSASVTAPTLPDLSSPTPSEPSMPTSMPDPDPSPASLSLPSSMASDLPSDPVSDQAPVTTTADLPDSDEGATDTNQLLDIKQQALGQLSPLVGHLEQTPEEKFRTTMMMIQASDNQSLIQDAYAAAQEITDEKVKAQALLDVVNEINYFTQQNNS